MDKKLSKMSRTELLELMLRQGRELEQVRAELENANALLASRRLSVQDAGTLADASAALNDVLGSAQRAADQYLENIRSRTERQAQELDKELADTQARIEAMTGEAQARAEKLVAQAEAKAETLMQDAQQEARFTVSGSHREASDILGQAQAQAQQLLDRARAAAKEIKRDAAGIQAPAPEPAAPAPEKLPLWKRLKK